MTRLRVCVIVIIINKNNGKKEYQRQWTKKRGGGLQHGSCIELKKSGELRQHILTSLRIHLASVKD